ncbi:hypothetical protein H257_01552 [Aphanomyces astaci]|uniref:Uncharacterized protein n=1 Tax=Aphanomyces astaci TaxID=112090 RepID=W4H8L2_APHAT|nr:hypothetical protein H257_01552 [Aphanomyces astaci]ETV88257.1 hypothetical protein H257_01552 [Aphanomyces astaci]|eukprot:XP_009823120.1 hypothetical protein H257_01552 [Aphanomyces astaci]
MRLTRRRIHAASRQTIPWPRLQSFGAARHRLLAWLGNASKTGTTSRRLRCGPWVRCSADTALRPRTVSATAPSSLSPAAFAASGALVLAGPVAPFATTSFYCVRQGSLRSRGLAGQCAVARDACVCHVESMSSAAPPSLECGALRPPCLELDPFRLRFQGQLALEWTGGRHRHEPPTRPWCSTLPSTTHTLPRSRRRDPEWPRKTSTTAYP